MLHGILLAEGWEREEANHRMAQFEFAFLSFFVLNRVSRIPRDDIRYSLFDVLYSLFIFHTGAIFSPSA